eukprot:TRINITY_DN4003_c0_g1_i2.p1 TRINITY_DN4003_c0_g1~~TRINITY_DN4003_c0_g1_i2.p1  ORF type:complete len:426 (+),score=123.82 TRINITY_DN4003_c0_g1_i2:70-1278(+)
MPRVIGEQAEKQHTGRILVNEEANTRLFHWSFEPRNGNTSAPVILWMTGGPGCSGQLALFVENGPYKLDDNLELSVNPESWNNEAYIIFIDQPTDVGFSSTDDVKSVGNEAEVSEDIYNFVTKYMHDEYPHLKNNPFYIFGESYGGHYVPSCSARIVKGNEEGGRHINFKGFAVGNGMVWPRYQLRAYGDYAFEHHLIDKNLYHRMNLTTHECERIIDAGRFTTAYLTCTSLISDVTVPTNINPYDIRIPCKIPGLCYDFSNVVSYLNLDEVQQRIGVDKTWETCNGPVNQQFEDDWMRSVDHAVSAVLDAGKLAVFYSGDQDFICNHRGTEYFLPHLKWAGQSKWAAAEPKEWYSGGQLAGKITTVDNLSYVRVYQAGHMVPLDQPTASTDFVHKVLHDLF